MRRAFRRFAGHPSLHSSVLSTLESRPELVGVLGSALIAGGYVVSVAASKGNEELNGAVPARSCRYSTDDTSYLKRKGAPAGCRARRHSHLPYQYPQPHVDGAAHGEDTFTIPTQCADEIEAPTASRMVFRELGLRSSDVATLTNEGVLVLDGVLSSDELAVLAEELRDERIQQSLGTNPNALLSREVQTVVRSDKTIFIKEDSLPVQAAASSGASTTGCRSFGLPMLGHVTRLLRSLGDCLHEDGFVGFGTGASTLHVPQRTQLAVYHSGGAFYKPHRDGYTPNWSDGLLSWLRLRSLTFRSVTAILYVSDNGPTSAQPWRASDGGCLRLYKGDSEETPFVDIPPLGGRLVVFDSQRVLHEVRPCFKERAALTVWFLARD